MDITKISLEQLQNALQNPDIVGEIDMFADLFWTLFSQQGGDF